MIGKEYKQKIKDYHESNHDTYQKFVGELVEVLLRNLTVDSDLLDALGKACERGGDIHTRGLQGMGFTLSVNEVFDNKYKWRLWYSDWKRIKKVIKAYKSQGITLQLKDTVGKIGLCRVWSWVDWSNMKVEVSV